MKKFYSKIVIIKIDILVSEVNTTQHQTVIHVQKEMSEAEYKAIIDTQNFLQKVKKLVNDGVV